MATKAPVRCRCGQITTMSIQWYSAEDDMPPVGPEIWLNCLRCLDSKNWSDRPYSRHGQRLPRRINGRLARMKR